MSKRTLDFADGFESSEQPNGQALNAGDVATTEGDVQSELDVLKTVTQDNEAALDTNTEDINDLTDRMATAETDILDLEASVSDLPAQNDIELIELVSSPSVPTAGKKKMYAKDDGKLYTIDSGGSEKEVGSGGGGGSAQVNMNPDQYFQDDTITWDVQGISTPNVTYEIDPTDTTIYGAAQPGAFIMWKGATDVDTLGNGFSETYDISPLSQQRGYVIVKFKYSAKTAGISGLSGERVNISFANPDNLGQNFKLIGTEVNDLGFLAGVTVGQVREVIGRVSLYSGQTRLSLAWTWYDETTIAKGFAVQDLEIVADAGVPMPYQNSVEINLAGSGNFTAGKIRFSRAGNLVIGEVTQDFSISGSSGQALSATGLIPTWARPNSNYKCNVFNIEIDKIERVFVGANGDFGIDKRNWSGAVLNYAAGTSANSTYTTISYTVSDNRNPIISTTEAMFKNAQVEAVSTGFVHGPSGSWQTISSGWTEARDTVGSFSNGVFTAQSADFFDFSANAVSGNTIGERSIRLSISDGRILNGTLTAATGNGATVILSAKAFLQKGQTATLQFYQTSTANLSIIKSEFSATVAHGPKSYGVIGETDFKESFSQPVSAVPGVNTYYDVAFLDLEPGEWDIEGFVRVRNQNAAAPSAVDVSVAITTNAGNTSSGSQMGKNLMEETIQSAQYEAATPMIPRHKVIVPSGPPVRYYLKYRVGGASTTGKVVFTYNINARKMK